MKIVLMLLEERLNHKLKSTIEKRILDELMLGQSLLLLLSFYYLILKKLGETFFSLY